MVCGQKTEARKLELNTWQAAVYGESPPPKRRNVCVHFALVLAPALTQYDASTMQGRPTPSAKVCGVVWGLCVKREGRTFPFRSPHSQPITHFTAPHREKMQRFLSHHNWPGVTNHSLPSSECLCPYLGPCRITHL